MSETIKKHAFKIQIGTAVAVVLFVIGCVWNFAGYKADVESQISTMENQYNHCNKWYESLQEDVDVLEDKGEVRDIVLAEIQTELKGMNVILLEIKQKL